MLESAPVGANAKASQILPIKLTWRVDSPIAKNHKIFIHAAKSDHSVIAQHDAQPLNDLRSLSTLPVGKSITDNHDLALSPDFNGELILALGIYDPDTKMR